MSHLNMNPRHVATPLTVQYPVTKTRGTLGAFGFFQALIRMVNDEFFAWTRLIALELIEYDRDRGPKAELRLLEDEKAELSLKLHKIEMFLARCFFLENTLLWVFLCRCFQTITFTTLIFNATWERFCWNLSEVKGLAPKVGTSTKPF